MNILEKAIVFATKVHEGQVRKIAGTPYILHPLEVAAIVATMTDRLEVMAAGVLHDTIEDCNVEPEELKQRFGARVLELVQSETEDKLADYPPAETWQERKEASLLVLKNTEDRAVKILWLADKLSNMRSFSRQYRKRGSLIWQGLNQKDPDKQGWYYKTIALYVSELSNTDAYAEYTRLVNEVFGA